MTFAGTCAQCDNVAEVALAAKGGERLLLGAASGVNVGVWLRHEHRTACQAHHSFGDAAE
jgi:hypothetical protein